MSDHALSIPYRRNGREFPVKLAVFLFVMKLSAPLFP